MKSISTRRELVKALREDPHARRELIQILKEDLNLWVECPECEMEFRMKHANALNDRRPPGKMANAAGLLRKADRGKSKDWRSLPGRTKPLKWRQRRSFR